MKKNLTEMVFILDKSGSMAGLEADTVGGFNSMIQRQKQADGETLVSTVLFSNSSTVIHDRVDLRKIEPLTDRQYYVGGGTALIDAIGGAIHHIAMVHKYAREEDRPERTIFVITTDGMENASHRYSSDEVKAMVQKEEVKAMVQKEKEKYGWEFLFLGANIDAVKTAAHFGIGADRSVTFKNDHRGQQLAIVNLEKRFLQSDIAYGKLGLRIHDEDKAMAYSTDIEAAKALAMRAHEGQTDKAGLPYITHSQKVAARLDAPEAKVVGWLHDTVEDTPLTIHDIETAFGPETAAAVDAISRKEGESWSDYLYRVAVNPIARQVKISDLIDNSNLSRIPHATLKDVDRQKKYNKALKKLLEE